MRDIATTTLSGNLTRDVELRQLPSGADVARLRSPPPPAGATARNGSIRPTTSLSRCSAPRPARARSTGQGLPRVRRRGARLARMDRPADNKREAVTFKARQVLFEGARREPNADGNTATEPTPSPAPVAVTPPAAHPAGRRAAGPASATADDLPF